jgi:hypothetical protein
LTPDALDAAGLASAQRRILAALGASPLASTYYLSGGTALAAFYLHHRTSEDLDLFTQDEVPLYTLESFLGALAGVRVESYRKLHDRRLFLLEADGAPLKVEFTRFPFSQARPPFTVTGGLRIDHLLDIYLNKLNAACDRREPKDDVDLYFLLDTPGLPPLAEAMALAERKFGILGLRYMVQVRLLAVSAELPPTTPPVSTGQIAARFRREVEALARAWLE